MAAHSHLINAPALGIVYAILEQGRSMWECYHCGFQNVDAQPVCIKCRARKPLPGEVIQKRSFHASEVASQERFADEVMALTVPAPPAFKTILDKWHETLANPATIPAELALLERRQYSLRETLRLLIDVIKNPQTRGKEEKILLALTSLVKWDEE
jgi:hypothetical protein